MLRARGRRAGELVQPGLAELRTTAATLAIASTRTVPLFAPDAARPSDNSSVIIEFLVGDVDGVHQNLTGFVEDFVNEPTTMPWGNRSLLFRDPDGNLTSKMTYLTVTDAAGVHVVFRAPRDTMAIRRAQEKGMHQQDAGPVKVSRLARGVLGTQPLPGWISALWTLGSTGLSVLIILGWAFTVIALAGK